MSDWISHLQLGYKALSDNHPAVAYTHFHAAFTENPEHPLACFAWGQALAQSGRAREAVPLLERAAMAEPDLVEAACAWAKAVMDLGDFDSAARILREQETRHPQDFLVQLTMAEMDVRRGEPDAAEARLETARRQGAPEGTLRTGRAQVAQLRGLLASRAGDWEAASGHFRSAAELAPGWAGPWVNLGVLAETRERLEEAGECYEQALGIEPGHPVALYNSARLHARMGRLGPARERIARLLETVPDYPGGRELAARVRQQEPA